MTTRATSLLPHDKPKYIRIYDDGGLSWDRFTVVFTGNYRKRTEGKISPFVLTIEGLERLEDETSPMDKGGSAHLGWPVTYDELPKGVQSVIVETYCRLWDIPVPDDGEVENLVSDENYDPDE